LKKPSKLKEPPSPLTTERAALVNDEERKMVEAMERELVRPLTEQEKHLVLEPGAPVKRPRSS
jgi:hypothetical protein